MKTCSRCGKLGLLAHINANTGLCRACERHDTALYSELMAANRKTAFFRNGYLYDLIPRNKSLSLYEDRSIAYDKDTVIVSDGEVYYPEKVSSIVNLRIPDFDMHCKVMKDFSIDLSYILKMRCSSIDDTQHLALFIQAALYMMDASPINWGRDDYLQVIRCFYQYGMFIEGDRFESVFRHNNPFLLTNPFDESKEADHLSSKYYLEGKWRHHKEHEELKSLLPELMPPTYRGYAQIRSLNTKRFQQIVELAEKTGYQFDPYLDFHFCRRFNKPVKMEYGRDYTGKSPRIVYCECPLHDAGNCDGRNEFGLLCVYPSTGSRKVIFCIDKNPTSQLSKVFNYVYKRRIVSADNLCEEMGVSVNTARYYIEYFVRDGVLKRSGESSNLYHIAITREQAIERYGIITEERIPKTVGDPTRFVSVPK